MTPQAILPHLVLGVAIAGVEAELPNRLTEINALKDKPVILVCGTDKRSANAAALLRDSGFRDVHGLRGGMEQWNGNGLPVARRTGLGQT